MNNFASEFQSALNTVAWAWEPILGPWFRVVPGESSRGFQREASGSLRGRRAWGSRVGSQSDLDFHPPQPFSRPSPGDPNTSALLWGPGLGRWGGHNGELGGAEEGAHGSIRTSSRKWEALVLAGVSIPLERSELVGPPSLHPRKPPPAARHLLTFTPPKVGGIKEGELG